MKQTILGANGAIGHELAKSLSAFTQDIRLVSRNPKKVNPTDSLVIADLTRRDEVFNAVKGSDIAYLTIGLPYHANIWQQLWPSLIKNTVDACLEYSTKLVFFDNVYAIDSGSMGRISEASPINPDSKKGNVRAEVDRIVLEAVEKRKLTAVIARSPDFFSAIKTNSLLMNLVYDNLAKGKKAQWFCSAKALHSFGYAPELAKGTAMLGNTSDAFNQIWNLPTDPHTITGEEWIRLFAAAMGTGNEYSVLPGWLIGMLGLFVPIMKEMYEMRYQADRDYVFDSTKFNTYFKYSPITNAAAVNETVELLKYTKTI